MTCSLGLSLMNSCVNSGTRYGSAVGTGTHGKLLGQHPTTEARRQMIANEPAGDYYVGRRYFVKKTTFWGYLRRPGQDWSSARLTTFNEWNRSNPDRLPEDGPADQRFGFDQNYEYRIWGYYTGDKVYEPNSNRFLPEFKLQRYQLIDKNPGWLFTPRDRYDVNTITLQPQG